MGDTDGLAGRGMLFSILGLTSPEFRHDITCRTYTNCFTYCASPLDGERAALWLTVRPGATEECLVRFANERA
jgi:hypothetical protein